MDIHLPCINNQIFTVLSNNPFKRLFFIVCLFCARISSGFYHSSPPSYMGHNVFFVANASCFSKKYICRCLSDVKQFEILLRALFFSWCHALYRRSTGFNTSSNLPSSNLQNEGNFEASFFMIFFLMAHISFLYNSTNSEKHIY